MFASSVTILSCVWHHQLGQPFPCYTERYRNSIHTHCNDGIHVEVTVSLSRVGGLLLHWHVQLLWLLGGILIVTLIGLIIVPSRTTIFLSVLISSMLLQKIQGTILVIILVTVVVVIAGAMSLVSSSATASATTKTTTTTPTTALVIKLSLLRPPLPGPPPFLFI